MNIKEMSKILASRDNNAKVLALFAKTAVVAVIFIIVGFSLDVLSNGFTTTEATQRVLDNIWKPLAFAFAVALFYNPRKKKA